MEKVQREYHTCSGMAYLHASNIASFLVIEKIKMRIIGVKPLRKIYVKMQKVTLKLRSFCAIWLAGYHFLQLGFLVAHKERDKKMDFSNPKLYRPKVRLNFHNKNYIFYRLAGKGLFFCLVAETLFLFLH